MQLLVKGEPIQWHLPRTTYDRCPKCNGPLGFLRIDYRACMGPTTGPNACDPGLCWQLRTDARGWLGALDFSREEVDLLVSRRHGGQAPQRFLSLGRFRLDLMEQDASRKDLYWVRPSFLRAAAA